MFRETGRTDVAAEAYRLACEAAEVFPAQKLRALEGHLQLLVAHGQSCEALAAIRDAHAWARDHGSDLDCAGFALRTAGLLWDLREDRELEDSIDAARKCFVIWEAYAEIARCDLLLAAVHARRGNVEAFRVTFTAAVEGLQSEFLARDSGPAFVALHLALSVGICVDPLTRILQTCGSVGIVMLERLLASDDINVRLRVLDILGGMREGETRALLHRACADGVPLIARKSSLVLSKAREVASVMQVFLLGRFRMVAGDELLDDDRWPTRKIRSLFAYMATRRGEVLREDGLIDLFWDGGAKARHSLHNSVSQIRKIVSLVQGVTGSRSVTRKRDGYVFDPGPTCWIDMEEFAEQVRHGRLMADQGRWDEALGCRCSGPNACTVATFWTVLYEEWANDVRLLYRTRIIEGAHIAGDPLPGLWKDHNGSGNVEEGAGT